MQIIRNEYEYIENSKKNENSEIENTNAFQILFSRHSVAP